MSQTFDFDQPLRGERDGGAMATQGSAAWQRAASAAKQAWRSLRSAWAQRRYDTLHGLDEQTLKDIGLDRSEISSVEAERAHNAPTRLRLVDCGAA